MASRDDLMGITSKINNVNLEDEDQSHHEEHPMSMDEKRSLALKINQLSSDQLENLIEIVQRSQDPAKQDHSGDIEIDLDQLPAKTLRNMESYITSVVPQDVVPPRGRPKKAPKPAAKSISKVKGEKTNQATSTQSNASVVVIGGAIVDVISYLPPDFLPHTSCPGNVEVKVGGVGRNIVEGLTRLQVPVNFICPVADDHSAALIRANFESLNLSQEGVIVIKGASTAIYNAIIGTDGELVQAIINGKIFDQMTIRHLTPQHYQLIQSAKMVMLDSNLNIEFLTSILQFCNQHDIPVLAEPISVPKSKKLLPVLDKLTILCPNFRELAAMARAIEYPHLAPLSEKESAAIQECCREATVLLKAGVRKLILVKMGPLGALTVERDGSSANKFVYKHYPSIPVDKIVNVYGAGDSFDAGFLKGLFDGMNYQTCVEYGLICGRMSVLSECPVSPLLSPHSLLAEQVHHFPAGKEPSEQMFITHNDRDVDNADVYMQPPSSVSTFQPDPQPSLFEFSASTQPNTPLLSICKRMVDPQFTKYNGEGFHIYEDYDAVLNISELTRNNNKFYNIQLIESDNKQRFFCWTRWGRVGDLGQSKTEAFSSIGQAQRAFKKKFVDKTRNEWDNRANFRHVPGVYDMIQFDISPQPSRGSIPTQPLPGFSQSFPPSTSAAFGSIGTPFLPPQDSRVKSEEPVSSFSPLSFQSSQASQGKGARAVDKLFTNLNGQGFHVYEEPDCVYDADLNQTDLVRNNNKFYKLQLIESDDEKRWFVWCRWGRVGEVGQSAASLCPNMDLAKKAFTKKFTDKTKNKWEDRRHFTPVPGKYTLLELDD